MSAARLSPGRLGLRLFGCLVGLWLIAPTLVVVPMSLTDEKSFRFPPTGWSTHWYSEFFSDPLWGEALVHSLVIATVVAVIATILGTAAAFAIVRGRFPGKAVANTLLISPMVVPVVIIAIGMYIVELEWHLVGTYLGFFLAHTVIALPFVLITVSASLRTFDRRLEHAAATLGSGPLSTFFRVTLPGIRSGVFAGALFAFIVSFDEVVISTFLVSTNLRTLPVQMFSSLTQEQNPTVAVASTLMFVVTTVLLVVIAIVMRGRDRAR
ncbi:MAG TPA: ABC transporter permease [Solirubrobacterales bacterium]|nr:ABC transporter permease [Solirubrobacterales bacterium]